jgi:hypothetical protein
MSGSAKRTSWLSTLVPHKSDSRAAENRWPRFRTSCGILMHSSPVTTVDGLPPALAAIKFWSRDKFHGANALKRKINPTRVPIERKESIRWLENLRHSTDVPAWL